MASEEDPLLGSDDAEPEKLEHWKAWAFLFLAILLEVSGTVCMKLSDGYTKVIPSLALYAFMFCSLAIFPIALQSIELSTAYAVWSGIGTVLTVGIGIIWFGDTVSVTKAVSLVVITLGCVAIQYAEGVEEAKRGDAKAGG